MKYIFLCFFLITIHAFGQTCDSTIIVYQTNHDQFEPVTFTCITVDSIVNGLLNKRYFSSGQPTIKYEYDSLGRLTSMTSSDSTVYSYDTLSRLNKVDYFIWNGINWEYKHDTAQVNFYYSANRLDSTIKSNWNGSGFVPFYKAVRFYNAGDTLFQINIELFDSMTSWYVDTFVTVTYSPHRVDSLYASGVITTFPDEIRIYDSLERILRIETLYMGGLDMYQNFTYQCNQLSGYTRSFFGSHNAYNVIVTFDSLCRIRKIVSGHYVMVGTSTEDVYEYYYTDCNTMVVRADENVRICHGDTAELSAMFFGGTGPYQIEWNPNSVFPNDTSSMVFASPDSTVDYIVSVTDSNGLMVTDTIKVHVAILPVADIYISSIDTASICQSATLKTDLLQGVSYYWREILSPVSLSSSPELDVIYNGTYIVSVQENAPYWLNSCPSTADTFVFNYFSNPAPVVELSLECTFIVAHSTEILHYQWYRNTVLITDSIRDTLFVDSTGYYRAIGVDSLGCESALTNQVTFQHSTIPLSLSVSINHPTCDTCNDGYVFLNGSGGASPYDYTINGISTYYSYNDSLSEGFYEFCVKDQNNCMFCDSSVYLPVNNISIKKVSYYPNPFHDKLYLHYPSYIQTSKTKFIVFDTAGRIIKEFQLSSADFILSRESMTSGVYFFSIIEDGVVRDRGKIILN
jgi:YD repeat-containing protein